MSSKKNLQTHYMRPLFGNGHIIVLVKCTHNDIDLQKYVCMGL
jgi:hypothetical protein